MGKKNRDNQHKKSKRWLRLSTHAAGWLPVVILIAALVTGRLGFNPVEGVLRWTGRIAVAFLLLSLACTPLHRIFGLPRIYQLRKPLGLYAALYAGLHFAAFAIWDYRLDLTLIWHEIRNKPFIILGLLALVILLVLAGTSFRNLRRKWGKAWTWLHRLVYAAGILAVLHYLLAIKGDLFTLQGAYAPPLITAGALVLLLVLRIPKVYRPLRRLVKRE